MKLILSIEFFDAIRSRLPDDVQAVWVDREGQLDGDPSNAEVYLSAGLLKPAVLDKVLTAVPTIRWQQTPSAGVNHLLTPLALSRDMILTNGAGVHAVPIAEFVLAFMLDRVKHLKQLHQLQDQHAWKRNLGLQELLGAKLLIIGAGGIGQAIAQRAAAFGMKVWGSRKHPEPLPDFEKVVGADEWHPLLAEADFVVLATPLTPETENIINAEALRAMRSTSYLINIARGGLIDEAALVTALTESWIAGAGIDAFVTEPLPSDSPLWSVPNLFVTPHTSWNSPHTQERTVRLFLENLRRYRTGQPLQNVVDRQSGY